MRRPQHVDQFLEPAQVMVHKAVRLAHSDALMSLIRTEIELGMTFCQVVRSTQQSSRRARSLELADKGWEFAQRLLWAQAGHPEYEQVAARNNALAREIASLKEAEEADGAKPGTTTQRPTKVLLFRAPRCSA